MAGLFVVGSAAQGGCVNSRAVAAPRIPPEMTIAVPTVREAVLSKLALSKADRTTVSTNEPRLAWYRMSTTTQGQAIWSWALAGGRTVSAQTVGDVAQPEAWKGRLDVKLMDAMAGKAY